MDPNDTRSPFRSLSLDTIEEEGEELSFNQAAGNSKTPSKSDVEKEDITSDSSDITAVSSESIVTSSSTSTLINSDFFTEAEVLPADTLECSDERSGEERPLLKSLLKLNLFGDGTNPKKKKSVVFDPQLQDKVEVSLKPPGTPFMPRSRSMSNLKAYAQQSRQMRSTPYEANRAKKSTKKTNKKTKKSLPLREAFELDDAERPESRCNQLLSFCLCSKGCQ